MPIQAGQILLHYRMIEKIGEGGMGSPASVSLNSVGSSLPETSTSLPGFGQLSQDLSLRYRLDRISASGCHFKKRPALSKAKMFRKSL